MKASISSKRSSLKFQEEYMKMKKLKNYRVASVLKMFNKKFHIKTLHNLIIHSLLTKKHMLQNVFKAILTLEPF